MDPLIVTGCTPDYRSKALALAESARSHGLPIEVIPFADQGRWIDNCRQKPILIDSLLRDRRPGAPTRPLLWIDADGTILQRLPADLMARLASQVDFAACPSRAGLGRRYCTGTLWVNGTATAAHFVAHWAKLCAGVDDSDEAQLQQACSVLPSNTRLGDLPHTLGWLPCDGPPTAETVIQHRLSGRIRRAKEACPA